MSKTLFMVLLDQSVWAAQLSQSSYCTCFGEVEQTKWTVHVITCCQSQSRPRPGVRCWENTIKTTPNTGHPTNTETLHHSWATLMYWALNLRAKAVFHFFTNFHSFIQSLIHYMLFFTVDTEHHTSKMCVLNLHIPCTHRAHDSHLTVWSHLLSSEEWRRNQTVFSLLCL